MTKTPQLIGLTFLLTFLLTSLATSIPSVGVFNALAMTAGAAAYGCLAAAITIATRHPMVERVFGPLDKAYGRHKAFGMSAVGLLGVHVALTLFARDLSPLHAGSITGPVIPLAVMGVAGLLLLLVAAGSALNVKLPYHLFQKVHGPAAGVAFTILTVHAVVAVAAGPVRAPAPAIWTLAFAFVGVIGLATRVLSRRPRPGLAITAVDTRERAIEVTWEPPVPETHKPGQFVIVTTEAEGRRESHPFTLTNSADATQRSILVRASGDWTTAAQHSLHAGATLTVEGPFGDFLPGSGTGPEIWIAGGAGITPFLSALRTAASHQRIDRDPVHLIICAQSATDAPCWDEIKATASALPWLSIQSAFTDDGSRLNAESLDTLTATTSPHAHWYACGPQGLLDLVREAYARADRAADHFHAEAYSWR